MLRKSPFFAILLLVSVLGWAVVPMAAEAQQKATFNLNATENQFNKNPNNELRRTDIKPNKNADPFSGDDGTTLDPGAGDFAAEQPVAPPKPKKPLKAVVIEEQAPLMPANPMMAPQDLGGTPDQMPQRPMMAPPPQPAWNPNDPDSSPDMQLAWDMWHKHVAATIFDRFNFFAKAAFKHSQPLMARLTYQVTRDGHIINMNMEQKSPNVLFNVLVYQAVKSLEGDMSILAFPQGSQRMVVAKAGNFTQNYGQEGFRYTTGDKEHIRGR